MAGIIIAIMYGGLVFCIAEMSPALPHTGAAYSFARTAMGPWGGFLTGLCENVEYVVTPAVIVTFITAYVNGIFGFDIAYSPIIWILTYLIFLYLNVYGVALSFKVTLIITLLSLAVLIVFWISAIPNMDFNRWALNIGPDGCRTPRRQRLLFPVWLHWYIGLASFCGVALPRHRAVAAGGRGIGGSQARHAQGHHSRHADAYRLGRHDCDPEPVSRGCRFA